MKEIFGYLDKFIYKCIYMCIIILMKIDWYLKMTVLVKRKSALQSVVDSVVDQNTMDFWLQKVNPLWSVQEALAKIVAKEVSATDMVTLTLQVNRHFQFGIAGQHHPVFVTVNGVRYERSYSLTQLDPKHVTLTVKKVASGKVSTWLNDQAKIGDVIELGQPFGEMTLAQSSEPVVLLAAGSGITPMRSLLRDLTTRNKISEQPITLMYWVKQDADAAFKAEFEALAQQYTNVKFELYVTQQHKQARLNLEHVHAIECLAQARVYACGPSGFVWTVEQLFKDAALVMTEAFSLTEIAHDDVGFVNVTLTQSNKVLTIPKGQSILSALEQQNVKPNHGCRMGICDKCACHKAEGSTRNLVNGMQNHEPGNLLKICVNSAQSDLVIDL